MISQSQAPDQINLRAKNLIDGPMCVYDHSYHLPCTVEYENRLSNDSWTFDEGVSAHSMPIEQFYQVSWI